MITNLYSEFYIPVDRIQFLTPEQLLELAVCSMTECYKPESLTNFSIEDIECYESDNNDNRGLCFTIIYEDGEQKIYFDFTLYHDESDNCAVISGYLDIPRGNEQMEIKVAGYSVEMYKIKGSFPQNNYFDEIFFKYYDEAHNNALNFKKSVIK